MACEANNPPKTGNTRKKMVFFSQATPIFLPKRPQKGPFLLSVRFLIQAQATFGIDGEELALISGITPFWAKRGKDCHLQVARPPQQVRGWGDP
jgi:hypothetical protein